MQKKLFLLLILSIHTLAWGQENSNFYYWFDRESHPRGVISLNSGLMELDISELADGVHTFRYQVMYENGMLSQPVSHFFVKKDQPGNVITDYIYWLNDQNGQAKNVNVTRQKTYQMNTLLALPSVPLRSTQFHFEVDGTQPMVYPVNDFHIRFFDLYNNYTEVSNPYVDYAAGQQLTDVIPLQSEIRKTVSAPSENSIQWFSLDALYGDSLLFCLDKAATLQLFAPSGSEVMAVSRAAGVVWNGIKAVENGTYYAALHDVEDATATTVSLDYRMVENSLSGDVNDDDAVDIGDIVMVINVMTGTVTDAAIAAAADVNGDGTSDIGDIVAIIDIMTNIPPTEARPVAARGMKKETNDHVDAQLTGNDLSLSLCDSQDYSAFQLILTLPEGNSLHSVTINRERGKNHTLAIRPLDNGRYLILGYSLVGRPLAGSGELLTVRIAGQQPAAVTINDVVLATANGRTFHLTDVETMQTETTAIADVSHKKEDVGGTLYDLQGRHVGNSQPKKGIYIIGNKKSVIK